MKIHKYTQLEDLNKFLDTFDDDSNLYVRIVLNKKHEEVYYVVEKNSRKQEIFQKRGIMPECYTNKKTYL